LTDTQLQFFEDATSQVLPGGVAYYPNFIELAEADALFDAFSNLNWKQHVYLRTGTAPRMYVWMGIPYRSPNLANELVLSDWTDEAKRVKERVEGVTRCAFDSLNFNLYRNHRDSIARHSDGEAEGLWTFPIASVSFGAVRKFKWQKKQKKNDGPTYTQELGHGSLLVMPPWFQRDYSHEVPKQDKPCGPRINLTFRRKAR
jgi:alkylated DNA repair dioxygenase AlkB